MNEPGTVQHQARINQRNPRPHLRRPNLSRPYLKNTSARAEEGYKNGHYIILSANSIIPDLIPKLEEALSDLLPKPILEVREGLHCGAHAITAVGISNMELCDQATVINRLNELNLPIVVINNGGLAPEEAENYLSRSTVQEGFETLVARQSLTPHLNAILEAFIILAQQKNGLFILPPHQQVVA